MAIGKRFAVGASARMARGLTKRRPTTIATVPPMRSGGLTSSLAVLTAAVRAAKPAPSRITVAIAERCTGFGRGGRADRASVTGMRADARAGHHAAAVAVNTARSTPAPSSHHARRSDRFGAGGRLELRRDGNPSDEGRGRSDDGGDHAHHYAVDEYDEAKMPCGGADRGEHAELAKPALRDDREAGRRHETDEEQHQRRQHEHEHGGRLLAFPPWKKKLAPLLGS